MKPDVDARLDALSAAVERLAKERSLLRALTAVKQMMDLAPKDPRTERAIALISAPEVRGAPTKPAKEPDPVRSQDGWQTIPPAVALAAIPLAQVEVAVKGQGAIVDIGPFIPSEVSESFFLGPPE